MMLRGKLLISVSILAVLAMAMPAAADWGETYELTASDGASGDDFANHGAVGIGGNIAIVGARKDVGNAGSAYLYDVTTGNPELHKLTASDGAGGDYFGIAVGVSGTNAVVGAYGAGPGNNDYYGAAYAYDFSSAGSPIETKLIPNDALGQYHRYGRWAAIDGDVAMVSNTGHGGGSGEWGVQSGAVYVFDVASGDQLSRLKPQGIYKDDWFGHSVALSGDLAIIGQYNHNNWAHNVDAGAAYVYDLSPLFDAIPGDPIQLAILEASDGVIGDRFGTSVAISGTTAVVGAYRADTDGTDSGSAYLYDLSLLLEAPPGPAIETKLTRSDPAARDEFGASVGIDDGIAVIGAPGDDDTFGSSGSAYLFDATSGAQLQKLHASDPSGSDYFGAAVEISGENLIVATPGGDGAASDSGSAYLFTVMPSTLEWAGGAANWSSANWGDGMTPSLVAPSADMSMIIDAAAGDSEVTVAADFTAVSGTGPAGSVAIGENNTATLIVSDTVTLEVTEEVAVGGFGTLQVDGVLTAAGLESLAGSTLSGSGTIGAVTSSEGTVAPGNNNGNGTGVLTFQAHLELGMDAVYQCEIGQWDSDNVPDPWNPLPPTGPVNDMIHATTGELVLHGTLQLEATDKLSPAHELPGQPGVIVEWYGDQTRRITSTGGENSVTWDFAAVPPAQPEVYDLPGTGNWGQGHIGHGVFLTRESLDAPVIHPGITYDARGTQVHLFQAADGDTNGDRTLGSLDIQAILSANAFPDVQPADWPQGDFTGDGWCNGLDIQAILSTGLYPFLPGPYAAVEPGQPLDGVVDLLLYPEDVALDDGTVVPAGTLMIDPDGVILNGYVLRSESGIFTGAPAQQLNWFFVEDTDRQISGNMGAQLSAVHDLGAVVGPEWTIINPFDKQDVNPFDDLTLTYTVVGTPGTFVGNLIIVPEPSTLVMLLGTGALGLLWLALRRRRTR